ncbi:hypothetical protein CH063_02338, partial [Colletotrichum higginsianum]
PQQSPACQPTLFANVGTLLTSTYLSADPRPHHRALPSSVRSQRSRNSDRICWQPTETAYAYERWKLWRGGKGVSFSSHGAVKKGRQVENITRKGLLDDRVG